MCFVQFPLFIHTLWLQGCLYIYHIAFIYTNYYGASIMHSSTLLLPLCYCECIYLCEMLNDRQLYLYQIYILVYIYQFYSSSLSLWLGLWLYCVLCIVFLFDVLILPNKWSKFCLCISFCGRARYIDSHLSLYAMRCLLYIVCLRLCSAI